LGRFVVADRQEFLGQVQQQLEAWTRWLRDLDDLAVTSAKQLRADAEGQFRQRAEQVRELIQQGRTQWDRISAAGDEAWEGVAGHAAQTWTALQDRASALALQMAPAANDATAEPSVAARKPRPRPKKKVVAKARPRVAAKSKSRAVAKKRAPGPGRKKSAKKSTRKKAKPASKASKASKKAAPVKKAKRKARRAPRRKK
jgi:hypothetical protein